MSVENGKVCCNCRHCIRSRDEKYNITVCRCDVHDMYLSYASVMGGCCKHWTKKQEGEETGGRVMSDLKPCPFCNDTYIRVHFTKGGNYVVGCNTLNCICLHSEGKLFNSKEKAVEAWNRRVSDDE